MLNANAKLSTICMTFHVGFEFSGHALYMDRSSYPAKPTSSARDWLLALLQLNAASISRARTASEICPIPQPSKARS